LLPELKGPIELKVYLIALPNMASRTRGVIAGHLLSIDGVTDLTRNEEKIPKLRTSIDKGMPVPLGLVSARSISDIGDNH